MEDFDFHVPAFNPRFINRVARVMQRDISRNVRNADYRPDVLDINNVQIAILEQQTNEILENLNRMTMHLEQNRDLFQNAIANLRSERNMD